MGAVRVQIDTFKLQPGVSDSRSVLLDCWRAVLTFQARSPAGWLVNGAPLDAAAGGVLDGARIGMEFGRLVLGPNVTPINLNSTLFITGDGTETAELYVVVQREYWDPELPDLQRQSRSVAARSAQTLRNDRARRR